MGVYYSIDFDVPDYAPHLADTAANARAKLGPVAHYFDGIHCGRSRSTRSDAYGGYYAVKRLLDAKLISRAWQTAAWSGGQWDSACGAAAAGAAGVRRGGREPARGPVGGFRAVAASAGDACAVPPAVVHGILVSPDMGWSGHQMVSGNHGVDWKALNA